MPTDNQPAKSYIETVFARADGATKDWTRSRNHVIDRGGDIVAQNGRSGTGRKAEVWIAQQDDNLTFIAHARQDIPTLAKIALRAIEALEHVLFDFDPDVTKGPPCGPEMAKELQATLADINALAAKGSQ